MSSYEFIVYVKKFIKLCVTMVMLARIDCLLVPITVQPYAYDLYAIKYHFMDISNIQINEN